MKKKSIFSSNAKYRLVLSAVHMVYRLVNSTFNSKELLLRLTRLVCQLLHASSASVYLLDPSRKNINLIASFNGKINLLLDRKEDFDIVTKDQLAVALGRSIWGPRLIGIPLVADDNVGAIFVRRRPEEVPFQDFDHELLTVIAEQAVTAIKNLQLSQEQQKMIVQSIKSIAELFKQHSQIRSLHAPIYSRIIQTLAVELNMREEDMESLSYAGMLHNAGIVDAPYEILSKTSRLTPEEFKIIHDHPARSVEFIKPVAFLKPVLPIILYRHEKYDGTGYPSGLKKEQIPLGARLMSVVDAFEAMVQERSYRRKLSVEEALEELKKNAGTQFDPLVVQAFLKLSKQKKFRKYLSLIKKQPYNTKNEHSL